MFDLVTVRDFYRMLLDDFGDFMEEPHSVRRALHCAISAYHLHDWVWAEWLKSDDALRAKLGIGKNKDLFRAWLVQRCVWFAIIEDVANCTKHHGRPPMVEGFKVEASAFAFDTVHAGFDQGAWDGPIRYVASNNPVGPKGTGYLVFDLGADEASEFPEETDWFDGEQSHVQIHRYMPVGHILEVVVRMWRDFFRAHKPDLDMPISPHHVD